MLETFWKNVGILFLANWKIERRNIYFFTLNFFFMMLERKMQITQQDHIIKPLDVVDGIYSLYIVLMK